jgi:hypothetical protein
MFQVHVLPHDADKKEHTYLATSLREVPGKPKLSLEMILDNGDTLTVPAEAVEAINFAGRATLSVMEGSGQKEHRLSGSNAPTVSGFSPTSGPAGTMVSISGSNFEGAKGVAFGGRQAIDFHVDSPSTIRARVPAGAISGPIAVHGPNGSGESTNTFSVSG